VKGEGKDNQMPIATTENIYQMVYSLMREEGLDTEQVRERLCNEVDAACDSIEYGEDDEQDGKVSP
jgi:hypothetical protein